MCKDQYYITIHGILVHNACQLTKVYSARVLKRMKDAGKSDLFHNFPMTFDDFIIQNGTMRQVGDYVQWTLEGSIPGKAGKLYEGAYEIGGEIVGQALRITYRLFQPSKG